MGKKSKYTKKIPASFEPAKFEEMAKYADSLNEDIAEFIRKAVDARLEEIKKTQSVSE